MLAGPSPGHQWASVLLADAFLDAVSKRGLGFVFTAPLDVHLEGERYVQPDIVVLLVERAAIIRPTLIEGAPDLIVEIISTSSRVGDRTRKLAFYARAGVREYWIVDLDARAITVHADPTGDAYAVVRRDTEVARSFIVPGLAVEVARLALVLPPAE